MKILIVSPKNKTVFNFRGDLVRDMIASGNEVIVTGPDREFLDDIYALGVSEFVEVPFTKDNAKIKGDLDYYRRLKKVIREKKPDLVFSYTIKPVVYGSLAAKANKVPHICAMVTGLGRVYTSNGIKVRLLRAVTKFLYKKAFRACDRVIFQNRDDIAQFVGDGYLPAEKTAQVNGSGVNMERFARAPLPSVPTFLMVSRIIREKGVIEFCEAARLVKAKHPEARFILLGGYDSSVGAIKPESMEPYFADGTVEYPGEVKDAASFYRECSVFVLPSYYREGLPRTILEAMSSGRAVITTDWPGCREPIEDGKNGFLVPVKDAAAIAERAESLISDPALLARLADAAFETCQTKYEVGIVNRQMKEYIGY